MLISHDFNLEGRGSVVECLARDRGVAGSSLTGIADCDLKQNT